MPGYGARFWAERTADNRRKTYPRFRGEHTADAVVIGGGLTGCTIAAVLAAGGLDVILLEADRLAGGGTAGALGIMPPQPDAWFRAVESAAGLRVARIAWKEAHRGAHEFASYLEKLPTKSDLAAVPFLVNAVNDDEAVALRREQAARKAAGVGAPWLAGAAANRLSGTESSGALRPGDAFLFDPVRAALGLAGMAGAKGARIFEGSPVRRTRFTRKYADVHLANGFIRTRGVVVATGEPGALFGQLRRHVRALEGHVVVTEPLNAAMRREAGRAIALTESGSSSHWLRPLPEDRLLFAGALAKPVGTRQREQRIVQHTAQLMYELSVRYPVISGLPARWGWTVPVVSTPDGLPWIGPHRNYPFHFFAMAFGWHGEGLAWFAARAALRFFTASARREDEALSFIRYL